MKQFCREIGTTPKILRTDFDHKIMGKDIQNFIYENDGTIESAPPHLQSQNGLCERNWRSILLMVRNWIASAMVPSSFWWHAVKRATKVSNYISFEVDNKLTTPHGLVYGKKVDMRNLFPLFAVAYIYCKTNDNQQSYSIQSTKAILIGRSTITNTLQFYHPPTKSTIDTAMYKLDEDLIAGPVFGLPFDGGLHFNTYCSSNIRTRPPTYSPDSTVYYKTPDCYKPATVITIPMLDDSIYTIQCADGSML